MQPLYLKLAFPLLLAAAAHGATLPSLVQTRFKLHAPAPPSSAERVHKGGALSVARRKRESTHLETSGDIHLKRN